MKPSQDAEENAQSEASEAAAAAGRQTFDGGLLAHFDNKEELEPLTTASAQSQLKEYFSRYGYCEEKSSTCHQHMCMLDSPNCSAYTAEEKQDLVETTQKMLLKLITTGKCKPTADNATFCNRHGYCDLFASKNLAKGSCKDLDADEYADVVSLLRPSSDGTFDFVDDDDDDSEVHHAASRSRLERRYSDKLEPYETTAELQSMLDELTPLALQTEFFDSHGRCDEVSDNCRHHTCMLGTAECKPFSPEDQEEIIRQSKQVVFQFFTTGKCKPTPDNASFCSKRGYCKLYDAKGVRLVNDKCHPLKKADEHEFGSTLQLTPDMKYIIVDDANPEKDDVAEDSFQKENGSSNPPPKQAVEEPTPQSDSESVAAPAGDKVKRVLTSSSADKRAVSDDKFIIFHPSSSDSIIKYAQPSEQETQEFMELSWEINQDDLVAETIALAAGVHDKQGLIRFFDRLDAVCLNKNEAVQALASATEAQMLSESKGTGKITDAKDDDDSSKSFDGVAEPTKGEVRTLMKVCKKLTEDDVKLQAIATAAGIRGSEDLYKFRERVRTMGTEEKGAKQALTRVKHLNSMLESIGADSASEASGTQRNSRDAANVSPLAVDKEQAHSNVEAASKSE